MTSDLIDRANALWDRSLSHEEWYDMSRDVWPELVAELARWQKIAHEAKAEAMYNNDCITDDSPLWNEAKEKITTDYREQAAEELGIQEDDDLTIAYMLGSQKANERLKVLQEYVNRLEADYLSWVQAYYRDLGEEVAMQRAQAALEKIRNG